MKIKYDWYKVSVLIAFLVVLVMTAAVLLFAPDVTSKYLVIGAMFVVLIALITLWRD